MTRSGPARVAPRPTAASWTWFAAGLVAWSAAAAGPAAAAGTERVSVGADGVQANGDSFSPAISPGGRFVAFSTLADSWISGGTDADFQYVFVRDRALRRTERTSVGTWGTQADLGGSSPALAAEARSVAFPSSARNLVADDTNGVFDIFVRSR